MEENVASGVLSPADSFSSKEQYPSDCEGVLEKSGVLEMVNLGGLDFKVNAGVDPIACLKLPEHYRFPRFGEASSDIKEALIALKNNRSLYIYGLQGSGKDAFVQAFSHYTKFPAKRFTISPNTDIQSWLFTRALDEHGTTYEEGAFLTAVRDGYETSDGRRIPYLILLSDLDRASKSQAELLREVLDSIEGRIGGPRGVTYPVFPGTLIVATGNTNGVGDLRGRCVSANPMDSSLLDRFERMFQFHWLDWRDEEVVVKEKFPSLYNHSPDYFPMVGKATHSIREAISKEDIYAEFSHRALCSWLGHAEDTLKHLLETKKSIPKSLLKKSARSFLDSLSDDETRLAVSRLIDPYLEGGGLMHEDVKEEDESQDFFDVLKNHKKFKKK